MSEFLLEIITPEKQFFRGAAEAVTCRTPEGELGILKGHQAMVASLSVGEIKIKTAGEWRSAFIDEGFMEVRNDEVMIFAQDCDWPEEIDEAKTAEEKRLALEHIEHVENLKEHRHNEISLARAMTKLKEKKTIK